MNECIATSCDLETNVGKKEERKRGLENIYGSGSHVIHATTR